MADNTILTKIKSYFTAASTRENLTSGEELQTSLGKVKKWLSDLGTAAFTNSTDYAPSSHNQASSTINAMTGYSKPQSTSAIAATDTLNEAIGKLEKGLEDAGGGGETIPPIVINNVVDSYTKNKEFPLKINIDLNLIVNHPVRFDFTGGYRGSNSVLYLTYFQAIVLSSPYKGTIDANGKLVISESKIMGKANYTNINWSIIPVSDSYVNFYPSLNPWEDYVSIHIYSGTIKNVDRIIGTIIPIDFTAVTSVTYDGVTVWERT